jgi:peptidoglycan hydrolase-like protein with peptidoglycan-binding domain
MCSPCAHTESSDIPDEHRVQRRTSPSAVVGGGEVPGHLESELQGLARGGGHPLPHRERQQFEQRFGTSFADVRLHTDRRADSLTRALGAEAFTLGSQVAFREDRYQPATDAGQRLLTHELTHVAQQSGSARASATIQRTIGDGHDLATPRFAGNALLEAAFDNERLIRRGATGEHVRLLQDSLLAMGYALPRSLSRAFPGRGDGIFDTETAAAIIQFQTDAGAVDIDGIVGPETMGLFDTHDVSRPGARPPARTGPAPDPLGAAGCDRHFAGVTFTLGNQVAAGVAPGADIRVVVVGGQPLLRMRGIAPIVYRPQITIAAPNDPSAGNFRIGFVQNLLTSFRQAAYSGGARASTVVPTLPIKDGDPNDYHPIFVTGPHAAIVEDFATAAQSINLTWPDTPADGKFINLLDDGACAAAGLPGQQMTGMTMVDSFRIWVVVQHRPSGCVRALHHVDWLLAWLATVNAATAPPTVNVLVNRNVVTQPNGSGNPGFIQGGPVPGQTAVSQCT